jgi:hypothetical protein
VPCSYTQEQLREAVAVSRTMRQVLLRLGLVPSGGNYETVRDQMRRLGISGEHLSRHTLNRHGDADIARLVAASHSYAEVFRRLGLSPTGWDYRALRRWILSLGLDTSHFVGSAWRRGVPGSLRPRRPIAEYLVEGRLVPTSLLRCRLLEEGVFDQLCQRCGRREWNGQPIPLELDHLNGDRTDNRLKNLRVLCPNCHAQTDTYRGRNIGRGAYV